MWLIRCDIENENSHLDPTARCFNSTLILSKHTAPAVPDLNRFFTVLQGFWLSFVLQPAILFEG